MVPAHLRHWIYQSGIRVTYRPRLKYGLFAEEITIVVFVLADPQSNALMEENRSRFCRSSWIRRAFNNTVGIFETSSFNYNFTLYKNRCVSKTGIHKRFIIV